MTNTPVKASYLLALCVRFPAFSFFCLMGAAVWLFDLLNGGEYGGFLTDFFVGGTLLVIGLGLCALLLGVVMPKR